MIPMPALRDNLNNSKPRASGDDPVGNNSLRETEL